MVVILVSSHIIVHPVTLVVVVGALTMGWARRVSIGHDADYVRNLCSKPENKRDRPWLLDIRSCMGL